jgi:hypothetical protein
MALRTRPRLSTPPGAPGDLGLWPERAGIVTSLPAQTNLEKGLIRALELGKVTGSKAPRLKVQSPGGREGENPAEGVVSEA